MDAYSKDDHALRRTAIMSWPSIGWATGIWFQDFAAAMAAICTAVNERLLYTNQTEIDWNIGESTAKYPSASDLSGIALHGREWRTLWEQVYTQVATMAGKSAWRETLSKAQSNDSSWSGGTLIGTVGLGDFPSAANSDYLNTTDWQRMKECLDAMLYHSSADSLVVSWPTPSGSSDNDLETAASDWVEEGDPPENVPDTECADVAALYSGLGAGGAYAAYGSCGTLPSLGSYQAIVSAGYGYVKFDGVWEHRYAPPHPGPEEERLWLAWEAATGTYGRTGVSLAWDDGLANYTLCTGQSGPSFEYAVNGTVPGSGLGVSGLGVSESVTGSGSASMNLAAGSLTFTQPGAPSNPASEGLCDNMNLDWSDQDNWLIFPIEDSSLSDCDSYSVLAKITGTGPFHFYRDISALLTDQA